MPSTYSTSLGLELMATGEQAGAWGTKTNTNLGTLLEQAITGVTNVTMIDANYTLSTTVGASNEARNAVVRMVGTLTATRNVIVPLVNKLYVVKNGTVGGFDIIVKTSTGTGVDVPNGYTATLYCDGTNVTAYGPLFNSTNGDIIVGDIAYSFNAYIGGDLTIVGNTSSAGDVSVSKSNPTLTLSKTASGQYNYISGSTSGSLRWQMNLGNSESESGANAGSNFSIRRFDDSGTLIGSAVTVNRATGAAAFSGDVSVTGSLGVTGSLIASSGGLAPTGSMMAFAGSSAPTGWLLCAGQQVSTTTYAALYAIIGTTYGSGSGTFGIPDLRGRVPAGKDDMGGSAASRITSASSISGATLGAVGGNQLLQSHGHSVTITDPGHTHAPQAGDTFWGNNGYSSAGQPTGGGFSTVGGRTASSVTGISATASNSGSGGSQNMPPVIIANYIIKA